MLPYLLNIPFLGIVNDPAHKMVTSQREKTVKKINKKMGGQNLLWGSQKFQNTNKENTCQGFLKEVMKLIMGWPEDLQHGDHFVVVKRSVWRF